MSSIRLTGLATGIDTESMIKELMKAERTKVDKVKQQKQLLQWKQELYTSINKDFANLILNVRKEFGLNVSTTTGSIDSKSLSSLTWVKKATSSNENAVKASTTSQAVNGTHEITVHRLADGVKAASSTAITKEIEVDGKKVKDNSNLASQFGLNATDIIEFSITTGSGKTVNFVFGSKVQNGGAEGGNTTLPKGTVGIIDKSLDQISLNDVVKVINSATTANGEKLGVQASYDSGIDRFFIQTIGTGKDVQLKIDAEITGDEKSAGAKFIEGLNLNVTSYKANGEIENDLNLKKLKIGYEYTGVDAEITFNGAEKITKSSNQFTINGINLDLRQANPNEKITIKVDTDVDAVYDKIKSFVDKYNELVDKIGKLLTEKKYSDYSPLTDEQKEEMTEKQIELWEEKAKSGLLRNDTILSSIMQNIRGSLYDEVDALKNSPINSLYQLGIETEKYSVGTVGGKLEINEEKLRQMITQDVDVVLKVLFSEAETEIVDGKTVPIKKSGGVITRIFNYMIDGMGEILAKAGPGDDASLYRNINTRLMIDFVTKYSSISMLDKDITDINKRINDLNTLLNAKEDKYYRQFSSMETLIQKLNNQGNWLSQQLGL